jgi:UV DNA damage endonuclease
MNPVSTPALGLVCITVSDAVRYRTTTRAQLLSLPEPEQRLRLQTLYRHNLDVLNRAIDFCTAQGIRLYRIPSNIFPFADTEQGETILRSYAQELRLTGLHATSRALRLVIHPDQFVVLSSDSPTVVENSLTILQMHARTLDLLGQPRSPWALMEIHGGKANRAEALIRQVQALPAAIRSRLALENDEYAYGPEQIYEICQAAGVPMIYDAHHHVVHDRLESYEDPRIAQMVAAARRTWAQPEWQLVHISNGQQTFADRAHHDLIQAMPSAYRTVPWIEVEAKAKEVAIQKLQAEWLPTLRAAGASATERLHS